MRTPRPARPRLITERRWAAWSWWAFPVVPGRVESERAERLDWSAEQPAGAGAGAGAARSMLACSPHHRNTLRKMFATDTEQMEK